MSSLAPIITDPPVKSTPVGISRSPPHTQRLLEPGAQAKWRSAKSAWRHGLTGRYIYFVMGCLTA